MQTERDFEIVDWIARLGAAGAEHVMERFAMSRTRAYACLSRLLAEGLLEQRTLLYRQPGLYIATAEGLRWSRLERLGVYRVGPGAFQHARETATAAITLHRCFPAWRLLSDREIRIEESAGALVASAKLGELAAGRPILHRPDLAVISSDGRVVAVEVELSVKAPRRLAAICRGWARARHIHHVYYLASDAPAKAVGRAVNDTRSHDRITIVALHDPDALLAADPQDTGDARR